MSKKIVINLNAMKAQTKKVFDDPSIMQLNALICGERQAGKSTLLGTVSGDALLITTNDEKHCINAAKSMAAKKYGANITSVIIDIHPETMTELTVDEAYAHLLNLLDTLVATENVTNLFQWIAIESINSIFNIINNTTHMLALVESNKFKANEVSIMNLMNVIKKLNILNERGVNILATIPCSVEQNKITGLYDQVEPIIQGYKNNLQITGIFGDILFVGPGIIEGENGEQEQGRYLQFVGAGSKQGKHIASGKVKYANFRPRINGLDDGETPNIMNADLTELLKYKRKIIKRNKKKALASAEPAQQTTSSEE